MDSRAQFEAWFKTHWVEKVASMSMFERHRLHNIAWSAWRESRTAIEVELPEKVMVEDEFDRGHNYGIEYCEEAIKAAGLRIKGVS